MAEVEVEVAPTCGDVSAVEQLDIYKMFMKNYVDHNCSITVHVQDHEWSLVEDWVWENWDDVLALSFLSFEDSFYDLLPQTEQNPRSTSSSW